MGSPPWKEEKNNIIGHETKRERERKKKKKISWEVMQKKRDNSTFFCKAYKLVSATSIF